VLNDRICRLPETISMRASLVVCCFALLGGAAWLSLRPAASQPQASAWTEVAPGVWRSPGPPYGYALVRGERVLLIDAPDAGDGLRQAGVKHFDGVLLTHHHRDTAAFAGRFVADKVPVRAPKASLPWLSPEGVSKYWVSALPLRDSRTDYLVLPEGVAGIDATLVDGQTIDWQGWTVRVVETPGHSRDHVAYALRWGPEGPLIVCCGDALAAAGKVPTPYTADWDHWTDAGQKVAAASLRKLAGLEPAVLLPVHGPVIDRNATQALRDTADAVAEVAFLKSFERFTKERLGNAPQYAFLAREQAESNGSKPWSRLSEHLFLTGNTYVLTSKDEGSPFLVVDPWDPHSARQIPKLKVDQHLGPIEVVLCSHAHFDHYDGYYSILEREKPQFWTLDRVAAPLADPFRLRAPFVDARPIKIDRRAKDGETLTWREYRLRFRHLPGQTLFTCGIETTIDGKRCFLTADNFFHQDQFSGSGGWMGLNRSHPLLYAASAQKVLDAQPDWVLCEHGGAMVFNAEDFRRRVAWGQAAAKAADAISPSGSHLHDGDPHRVHVEPILHKARPGVTLAASLMVANPLPRTQALTVTLVGRGLVPDQTWELEVPANDSMQRNFTLKMGETAPAGRQVFALRIAPPQMDGADAVMVVDVER
jgi:glyoxylase-like metal-dependent hydrolase (beta-lactamase superfamily II)